MSKITLSTETATHEQALYAANEIEKEFAEISMRKRKPGNFTVEHIARLIQFARNHK